MALRRFYQAGHHLATEAAMCPEPLCRTSVLPSLGRCMCHLLRGRYPSSSLLRPSAAPVRLSPASAFATFETAAATPFGALRCFYNTVLRRRVLTHLPTFFGVQSHCLPLRLRRHNMVGGLRTKHARGARTGFVQALCKTSPMSAVGLGCLRSGDAQTRKNKHFLQMTLAVKN